MFVPLKCVENVVNMKGASIEVQTLSLGDLFSKK